MLSLGERVKRYLTFASGIFECIGFAGAIFGWASLVFVLKEEGYFYNLCVSPHNSSEPGGSNGTVDCYLQDERFALIFTMASFMDSFTTLPGGYIFDRFGTMPAQFMAISMYTTGTLLVAFSTAASAVLLFPAACLLAVGGGTFYISNMQIGNLFGDRRSTVITLYNGAFASSSCAFLLVKVLYQAGFSVRSIFLFISSMSIVHVLRVLFLLPRKNIPYPLPEDYTYGITCKRFGSDSSSCEEETARQMKPLRVENEADREMDKRSENKQWEVEEKEEKMEPTDHFNIQTKASTGTDVKMDKVRSFRSCIFSRLFVTHLMWISVLQLRHYLFIGTLNPMLMLMSNGDTTEVSKYTNAFALTQICGFFCAPWNGIVLDWLQQTDKTSKAGTRGCVERLAGMRSAVVSLIITITQCVLFSISATIPILEVQYMSFILQVINHSFLYGGDAAFISIVYPSCHFGKIYGVGQTLSAFISLLQYPCFALIQGPLNNDPLFVNIGFIVLVILTYTHPLNLYLHWRQELQQSRTKQNPQVGVKIQGDELTKDTDV
ncbi:solute carrier family 43 member 3-like [Chiloscyllium plagiosum]|uniref:solute carrier family 43 member 3-like n=1 Tax=Chiloscyllium plagiosum TaxID=36176 RepID=UPI001CB7E355|nr:solute carrier family 43 member 3-like [Chiloscyllium plagiosum]